MWPTLDRAARRLPRHAARPPIHAPGAAPLGAPRAARASPSQRVRRQWWRRAARCGSGPEALVTGRPGGCRSAAPRCAQRPPCRCSRATRRQRRQQRWREASGRANGSARPQRCGRRRHQWSSSRRRSAATHLRRAPRHCIGRAAARCGHTRKQRAPAWPRRCVRSAARRGTPCRWGGQRGGVSTSPRRLRLQAVPTAAQTAGGARLRCPRGRRAGESEATRRRLRPTLPPRPARSAAARARPCRCTRTTTHRPQAQRRGYPLAPGEGQG